MAESFSKQVENIVGKGEITPFPPAFSPLFSPALLLLIYNGYL